MLSGPFIYILVAATFKLIISSSISPTVFIPISENYTDENNSSDYPLEKYSVEVIGQFILTYLKEQGLHPEDENAQQQMCQSWAIYENNDVVELEHDDIEGRLCGSFYDNILCWPPSPPGVVSLRCPRYWNGIAYESDVTRRCYPNGTWAGFSDYSKCRAVIDKNIYADIAEVIMYIGYSVSFVSLVIAFGIFLAFKSLRCLRNYIHWNFIISFILLYVMFFSNHQLAHKSLDSLSVCRLLMMLIIYAQCTNFFWMFVEGLYLYTLVVMALKPEKMTLLKYCLIGWGVPVIITVVYVICERKFGSGCWASIGADLTYVDDENGVQYLEFIFVGPIVLILMMNTFFLCHIGFILMTKLKASHSFETKQYRKALRGIVLLLPLLGVTGMIFIINFAHPALIIVNALLHSFEGFFVVLIYVFCNQEVQRVIKRKIHHWREEQSLPTRQVSRRGSQSRQNSIVSAMYTKHNGDNVVFDKSKNNAKVGCCNFTKTQKSEGYNIMNTPSFDASTRQSSLEFNTEKTFVRPGFESISEVSTGQENSYSKSDNNSLVYQEKHPDSNQNIKVPSSNGSINKLTIQNESENITLRGTICTETVDEAFLANSDQVSEAPEPGEHNTLLEKTHETKRVSGVDDNDDLDTETSALVRRETDEAVFTDDMSIDFKHKNSMIIPKGLTIGTQL